jgi:pyrimidine operon attenuation protein/uracil phosphoribosyltransferase
VAHLDVTLYRDDLACSGGVKPYRGTELLCPLDGRTVILVDDVFHTGRTIRAALDLLMDYGRPRAVRLYVLVDRGGRELPLRPDQAGETLAVRPGERVVVRLKELDGADAVVLAPEK